MPPPIGMDWLTCVLAIAIREINVPMRQTVAPKPAHAAKYPAATSDVRKLRCESSRNLATRRYSSSIGSVDGNIIATIIATHIAMNNRNCLGEPEATSIHIMLMFHPPGMGMVIDIVWLNQAVMDAAERKTKADTK